MRIQQAPLVLMIALAVLESGDAFTCNGPTKGFNKLNREKVHHIAVPLVNTVSHSRRRHVLQRMDGAGGDEEREEAVSADTNKTDAKDPELVDIKELSEAVDVGELSDAIVSKLKGDASKALDRALAAEQRVDTLQKQVNKAESELREKESLLKEGTDFWAQERAKLAARIAEFTNQLQKKDVEFEDTKSQLQAEALERRSVLEEEIEELKQSLKVAKENLKTERETAEEIKSRLFNAEDQLEFEQMRFQKEKAQLGEQITEEKSKLEQAATKFSNEQRRFEADQEELQKSLEEEKEKLKMVESQLQIAQENFSQEKVELEKTIEKRTSRLEGTQAQLKAEQKAYLEEKREFNLSLELEKSKLIKTKNELALEQKRFEDEKNDLETTIILKGGKIEDLENLIERERDSFFQEKAELEFKIEEERARLEEVEAELESETFRFADEKRVLEEKIADGERIRKLKLVQWSDRYDAIRKEMNALLGGTRRDARKEKRRLQDKYEKKLAERNDAITSLQEELNQANVQSESLNGRLLDMTRQKVKVLEESRAMEKRYMASVAERNAIIDALKTDVAELQNDVFERDRKVARYEGSFREQAKLSAKLAGKRIRNLVRLRRK